VRVGKSKVREGRYGGIAKREGKEDEKEEKEGRKDGRKR